MFLATRALRGAPIAPRIGVTRTAINLTKPQAIPSARSFSIFGSKKIDGLKTTLFKPIKTNGSSNNLMLVRNLNPMNANPITTDEDWREVAAKVPFLPYGVVHSLILPLGFLAAVGVGAILWANSDRTKKKRERRMQNELRAANKLQPAFISDANKMLLTIFGINAFVYILWQLRFTQYMMQTHFLHGPLNKSPISGLLSTFSHKTTLHFAVNMLGLYSFGLSLDKYMSREQILAFYLAGGCFASGASHIYKLLSRDLVPSLGASGAVYSMIAASSFLNPDARYAFIFFPMYDFSASTLFPIIVAVESILLLGHATRIARFGFDHAAHLGGAAFGWYYTKFLVDRHTKNKKAVEDATEK